MEVSQPTSLQFVANQLGRIGDAPKTKLSSMFLGCTGALCLFALFTCVIMRALQLLVNLCYCQYSSIVFSNMNLDAAPLHLGTYDTSACVLMTTQVDKHFINAF
jgi:hypothetical protein